MDGLGLSLLPVSHRVKGRRHQTALQVFAPEEVPCGLVSTKGPLCGGCPMDRSEISETLRRRALYWLAQREQSEAELRRKLNRLAVSLSMPAPRRGAGALAAEPQSEPVDGHIEASGAHPDGPDVLPALIDQLLDWLREQKYLSDQRFIDSRLRVRQSRFGMQRIQSELAQHGLSLGEEDRQHLAQTELNRAHEVWARKFGDTPATEPAARAAQTRFLAQRGFSGDVIRRVLRGDGTLPDAS